jgi:hypothetical protein
VRLNFVGEWAAVKATEMTGAGSYGAEALKAMGQAFDEVWLQIAGNFGDPSSDVEKARAHLSRALYRSPMKTAAMSRF